MFRGLQRSFTCLVAGLMILPATARAQDTKDVKAIATAKDSSRNGSFGPFYLKREGAVIRNAEELVASSVRAKFAKDPEVQKAMEAELAKILKVDAIDWSKQMVLGVIGEGFDPVTIDGKVLTATFVPFEERPMRAIPPIPKTLLLVERFEGEVKFVAKKKK